jgi:hypothetical protein
MKRCVLTAQWIAWRRLTARMQTNPYTSKTVAAMLLLGAIGPAFAAPVGVGAGVAGSVGVTPAGVPGLTGSNAGVGATGGFGSTSARSANAGGSVNVSGAPDLHPGAEAFETIGMRQQRLATGAAVAGGNAINAPGMEMANQHAIDAVLNPGPMAKEIRAAAVDDREKVSADIDARVSATGKALDELKSHARSLSTEKQAEFKAAMKDTAAREKALRKSLKTARKASAETWASANADLAANYEAYANSAEHAELLAASANSASADLK